jgi:imidazolonepropionase-like amidohydrolase
VRIFDGKSETLTSGNVLVEGNLIKQISSGPIRAGAGATVIDGSGRTLMPGLIDAHEHLNLNGEDALVDA